MPTLNRQTLHRQTPNSRRGGRRLFLVGLASVVVLLAPLSNAPAGDWLFRRSYFSHVPVSGQIDYPVPESRSAYRRAIVHATPGFAIRGGYRYNRIVSGAGPSLDVQVIVEDFYNVRP